MMGFRKTSPAVRITLATLGLVLALTGCSSQDVLPKGMVGRLGHYDYSPSVIQTGQVRQFWWCGEAQNPNDHSQSGDAILYESMDMVTGKTVGPLIVLAETPGTWDALYTCNPKVIGGSFNNPLGDGVTYTYAMYYVGINKTSNNNIGVAFSNDGIFWKKYANLVIPAASPDGYGAGQPALYNSDHKSAITIFYEDSWPSIHHVKATSSDGLHFTFQGIITTNGIDPSCSWGDMAFDSKTNYWYALFDRPARDPATTGGVVERGQFGVDLYRIPDSALLSGNMPWEYLTTFDTNMTGFEANFIGGLVRDLYGNVNIGSYPTIQMYLSVSDPQPGWKASPKEAGDSADPSTWDIAPAEWVPNQPLMPLTRYSNSQANLVTTGWISPAGRFQKESVLGQLYQSPQAGASTALYGCRRGGADYFLSLDSACEGARILGTNGFAYSEPNANLKLVGLYRCESAQGHFVSQDAKCEGQTVDGFLGYVLP